MFFPFQSFVVGLSFHCHFTYSPGNDVCRARVSVVLGGFLCRGEFANTKGALCLGVLQTEVLKN